jgi:hypothetical protein
MNHFFFRITVILSLLAGIVCTVHAQTAPPANGIRVLVYGIHYGGNIVYNYKVINNGDTMFNNFTIGSEFYSTNGSEYPQLTRLPLGWSYGREGETGTAIILAPGSTSQPLTWTASVYGQQETDNYYLEWLASPGPGNVPNAILPGQTLAGFSVTVPLVDNKLSLPMVTGKPLFTGPDEMYINGSFKVGLASGKDVWGTLEKLDTTPPTLSVTLNPATLWPPNGKLVAVTADITVKDDYDPAPEIQLVSITANEALDRDDIRGTQPGTDSRKFLLRAERGMVYTVTYSAIDGSGNKSTASATVTVPHDQDKNEKPEDGNTDGESEGDRR